MRLLLLLLLFTFFSLDLFASKDFDPKGTSCSFKTFMTRFLSKEKASTVSNLFFVATEFNHPDREFWVYWPEKRSLFLIGWPASDCESPALSIRRRLDLTKDTVKSEADLHGSTYLVTEQWASKAIFSAAKNGYQVTVTKK